MNTLKNFITGSQYRGTFNPALSCMDGYGLYTYPDGSEYRGYFKWGCFHGTGRLKLIANGTFLIQGVWSDGELQTIEEITFPDGLRCKEDFLEHRVSTFDWEYLSKSDRRYSAELKNDLEPVGPLSYITAKRPARYIMKGCYDTEEGIYNPRTGFLHNIPKPFDQHRFVTSKAEREWIQKFTRRGVGFKQDISKDLDDLEPAPEDALKIISTNVKSMKGVGDRVEGCTCNHFTPKKHYFAKLCLRKNAVLPSCEAAQPSIFSAMSPASFSMTSIEQNVEENVKADLAKMEASQIPDSESEKTFLMDYSVSHIYSMHKRDLSAYKWPYLRGSKTVQL